MLQRYDGYDETPIRLMWSKDYGIHGLTMGPDTLFKLTDFENLSEENKRRLKVVQLDFTEYMHNLV